jgi:hypothetical protein
VVRRRVGIIVRPGSRDTSGVAVHSQPDVVEIMMLTRAGLNIAL